MRSSLRPLAILFLGSALAACTGTLSRWGTSPPPDPHAETLLRMGDYEGAMQRYQFLARTASNPDYYWLRAADAALRAGDGQSARQLADAINPRELEAVDRNQYLLLASRLDLNAGRAREAMAKLNTLANAPLEGGQNVNYHMLRASAYNQLGDMLASARERVELGALLSQPEAIQKNNEAIYDALSRLPPETLAGKQPPPPDILGGWMALTRILKTTPPGGLSSAVDQWRGRYPGHPAAGAFLNAALAEAGGQVQITPLGQAPSSTQPAAPPPVTEPAPAGSFIGVLLPLSGPYAPASQAIRAGMTAAYFADPNPAKPQLQFSDSQSGDVSQTYRRLADQGARAVVGPLAKEEVAALARNGDLPVPVLALNQAPGTQNPRLFQFGLAPEQEVEQAAGSAWFDGRQNALVLAPATQFGQRLTKHFSGYWRSLGGKIVATRTYPYHGQDFSGAIQGLTGALPPIPAIDGSGAAVTPTPSASGSFVFLIADSQDAHALMPQLASLPGGPLPVYATSHVYGGKADDPANQDLDGLVFCDIPWLLNPQDGGSLSAQALEGQIKQTPPDYVKLIALGLDAYRLIPELDRFASEPQYRYPGATGSLSLQPGNRLQRQLECAQFEGGHLQPRGIAPLLQPGAPAQTAP